MAKLFAQLKALCILLLHVLTLKDLANPGKLNRKERVVADNQIETGY